MPSQGLGSVECLLVCHKLVEVLVPGIMSTSAGFKQKKKFQL